MSKKCSTFALEMKKKQYIYPKIEITNLVGLSPLAIGDTSNHSGMAPKRRTTEVF